MGVEQGGPSKKDLEWRQGEPGTRIDDIDQARSEATTFEKRNLNQEKKISFARERVAQAEIDLANAQDELARARKNLESLESEQRDYDEDKRGPILPRSEE